jgi:threonine dehydratase
VIDEVFRSGLDFDAIVLSVGGGGLPSSMKIRRHSKDSAFGISG